MAFIAMGRGLVIMQPMRPVKQFLHVSTKKDCFASLTMAGLKFTVTANCVYKNPLEMANFFPNFLNLTHIGSSRDPKNIRRPHRVTEIGYLIWN